MNTGGAARVRLYGSTRPPANTTTLLPLVALILLADLAGVIDGTTGDLILSIGAETTVLLGTTPTWARVFSGEDQQLFDCDARLSTGADTGQELVIAAPDGFYLGAILRIQSGTLSARP
jgi:hypothetical protein